MTSFYLLCVVTQSEQKVAVGEPSVGDFGKQTRHLLLLLQLVQTAQVTAHTPDVSDVILTASF